MKNLKHFKKIKDYHELANLAAPKHPLISLIDYSQVKYPSNIRDIRWKQDYYTIGLKRNVAHKLFYGQQEYDFDEGILTFVAPNQIMNLSKNPNINNHTPSGWLLLVHPDFLWNTSLTKKINQYDFFEYTLNEALFLSEKEEQTLLDLLKNIEHEYLFNIDDFSQKIVVSHLELLLNYADRFYNRQFITRKISNHKILIQLEQILADYFKDDHLIINGIPSVLNVANRLNLSPNYLSNMLKSLTGQSTQQHIHDKLIEKAKEQLSTTPLSVSEIAYNLGFEYPASLTKIFKNKTDLSPIEFRKKYN